MANRVSIPVNPGIGVDIEDIGMIAFRKHFLWKQIDRIEKTGNKELTLGRVVPVLNIGNENPKNARPVHIGLFPNDFPSNLDYAAARINGVGWGLVNQPVHDFIEDSLVYPVRPQLFDLYPELHISASPPKLKLRFIINRISPLALLRVEHKKRPGIPHQILPSRGLPHRIPFPLTLPQPSQGLSAVLRLEQPEGIMALPGTTRLPCGVR